MTQKINQIDMQPWNYILYEVDNYYVLTVTFCEQVVDYSLSYRLTKQEESIITDREKISVLADSIRKDRESYKDRQVIPTLMV